jgi:hypothetical protein
VRRIALLALAAVLAGCGWQATVGQVRGKAVVRCRTGVVRRLGTARVAFAGVATHGAVAYRRPGGAVLARFGRVNVNGYLTVFGVVGVVLSRSCRAAWYRVELPLRPNGVTGFVRARRLLLARVHTRIVVDVAQRRLTLYRDGRPVFSSAVAVGSPSTPTPTGRFYVNQRLIPNDPSGPFGPAAIGISAFSNVLTGWTQGGPVAIHGTNEPWSIGHAVSNGCIRVPNAALRRIYPLAIAGTPVLVRGA